MPTKTVATYPNRKQLEVLRPDLSVAVPVTMKGGFACSQGEPLGKITSGGLYRRRSRAAVTTAFATDAATGVVDDASVFVVGDALKNAAGAAVGTITGINLSTNTITLSGNASNAVAIGANVFGSDGSQVAVCIADNDSDGVGDTPIAGLIGGYLDEAKLLRMDATAKAELGAVSVAGGVCKL